MNSCVSLRDKIANISDSVIIVKNVEFKVHKAFLSTESDVFHAMFSSELHEGRSGRVEINDVDPEVFDEFLNFIYTKTSPKLSQFPIQLMELADKYMVHHLLDLCKEFLKANFDVSNVCGSLIVAHRLNTGDLKNNLFEFVRNHLSEIVERDDWKKVETYFDLMTELSSSFPKRQKPKINPSPVISEEIRAAIWQVHREHWENSHSPVFTLQTNAGDLNFCLHMRSSASTLTVRFLTLSKPRNLTVLLCCKIVVLNAYNTVLVTSSVLSNLWTREGDEINFEVDSCGRNIFSGVNHITICMDVMYMKEVPRAKCRFMEKDQLSEYFDVSFKINSRVFNGHRAILAGRSPFFYDLFKNPDRVAEPHYVITETTEEAFEIILNYLYTDEFPPTELMNLELLKYARLFVLPDLYTEIELHCKKNLTVENAIPSLIVAHQLDSEQIKAEAVDIISKKLKRLANYKEQWSQLSPLPQLITPILIRLRENLQ